MKLFRDDNTEGYSPEELNALNAEWEQRAEEQNLEEYTDEYNEHVKWFCDEVASRQGAYTPEGGKNGVSNQYLYGQRNLWG